jgi:mannose-6-phosphate isomerase
VFYHSSRLRNQQPKGIGVTANIDHPLRFLPIFRRYLWGGRRLETLLGKSLPAGDDFAESWEIVDRVADQSVVVAGPWQGTALQDLIAHDQVAFYGRSRPAGPFPLLFKFLDAHRDLSVQVHPDDTQAARLNPPDRGKTEAWVVLHADPGSQIYAGLRPGIDRAALSAAIQQGNTAACLHRFEPATGDCVFIPAGTVHALGAGLVVAEIQQSSDVTYRLFDWNRVGADGQPRPLHIEAGLETIDFSTGPVNPVMPSQAPARGRQRLVACEKFVLDRCRTDAPLQTGGDDRLHILAVVSGAVILERDPMAQPLNAGQTVILPAAAGPLTCTPQGTAEFLDIYLPSSESTGTVDLELGP